MTPALDGGQGSAAVPVYEGDGLAKKGLVVVGGFIVFGRRALADRRAAIEARSRDLVPSGQRPWSMSDPKHCRGTQTTKYQQR